MAKYSHLSEERVLDYANIGYYGIIEGKPVNPKNLTSFQRISKSSYYQAISRIKEIDTGLLGKFQKTINWRNHFSSLCLLLQDFLLRRATDYNAANIVIAKIY